MTNEKTPFSTDKFHCEICAFRCSKKCDYNRHLSTDKHKLRTIRTLSPQKTPTIYQCGCGSSYKHSSSLWNHRQKCISANQETLPVAHLDENVDTVQRTAMFGLKTTGDSRMRFNTSNEDTQTPSTMLRMSPEFTQETSASAYIPIRADNKDTMIEQLLLANYEIKTMFAVMLEKYQEMQLQNQKNTTEIIKEATKGNQELVNKMIEVMPKIGNVTNNTTNNTLNFYLTNTCKNAESIHDFTDRYVKRCSDFFIEHYRDIANNQMCLATNVYEIMFKCLEENPQYMNFIQTTCVKNGIHYVKEKKKDENRQLYGEAEFIKYIDGFEKAGASIGHALNKAIFPLQTEFTRKLEREIGIPPNESDFEDDDEYEDALDKYKIRRQDATRNLQLNVCNTMSLFDSKTRKMDILNKTRRVKEGVDKIDNI